MAQYFAMNHTFPEQVLQPLLADMDDDDKVMKELINLQVYQGWQTKVHTLPLAGIWCD